MHRSGRMENLLLRVLSTGQEPAARLRALTELRRELDLVEAKLAAEAITAGMSWTQIGSAIGVTKQAAHRRHRNAVEKQAAPARKVPHVSVSVQARRAIRLARHEAAAIGVSEVDTEHLLLGLLRSGDMGTAVLFQSAGVTLEGARAAVLPATDEAIATAQKVYESSVRTGPAAVISPVARRALERALTRVAARGERQLTALDLLYALILHDETGAARTLRAMGVEVGPMRAQISGAQRSSLNLAAYTSSGGR